MEADADADAEVEVEVEVEEADRNEGIRKPWINANRTVRTTGTRSPRLFQG